MKLDLPCGAFFITCSACIVYILYSTLIYSFREDFDCALPFLRYTNLYCLLGKLCMPNYTFQHIHTEIRCTAILSRWKYLLLIVKSLICFMGHTA